MNGRYCLCNHSAEAHGLLPADIAGGGKVAARCHVAGCRCTAFEEDPLYEPSDSERKEESHA